MEVNQHAAKRRERRRASALTNQAGEALKQSQRLAGRGDLTAAERAARLAERHVKLAERLINLKAAFQRIADARRRAERAFEEVCSEREAALKAREDKLYFAELAHKHREQHAPPLDPEADRWKERLALVRGEEGA